MDDAIGNFMGIGIIFEYDMSDCRYNLSPLRLPNQLGLYDSVVFFITSVYAVNCYMEIQDDDICGT